MKFVIVKDRVVKIEGQNFFEMLIKDVDNTRHGYVIFNMDYYSRYALREYFELDNSDKIDEILGFRWLPAEYIDWEGGATHDLITFTNDAYWELVEDICDYLDYNLV